MTHSHKFNGHLLKPDELAECDPADTEVCAKCGGTYYTTKHQAKTCYGCYYQAAMDDAAERFAPLTLALASRLEVMPDVWQTGGMVMCLHVPMPNKMYALFSVLSEMQWDDVFFCVYQASDDFDGDEEDVATHKLVDAVTAGQWEDLPEDGCWRDLPQGTIDRIADWAALEIAGHLK